MRSTSEPVFPWLPNSPPNNIIKGGPSADPGIITTVLPSIESAPLSGYLG